MLNLKISGAFSIISLIVSWVYAQAQGFIDQGFDQLFSIGLLVVAVITIWKAFLSKDKSETTLLKEQIKLQQDQIKQQQREIEDKREERNRLVDRISKIQNGKSDL